MWCPNCANEKTNVIGTHLNNNKNKVRRFRVCPICEYSFLSVEFVTNYDNKKEYIKNLKLDEKAN